MSNFDFRFHGYSEIGLAVCTDWHIGSHTCDEDACREWVSTIGDNDWRALLCGDLLEMALKTSVGDIYEQHLTPLEQIDRAVEILRPIKDNILWAIGGNHSQRAVRAVGIDPDLLIARELGVGYSPFQAAGRVQVGEAHWKIGMTHGAGGGSLMGSKLNTAMKMAKIYADLDLYVSGHTHADLYSSDTVKLLSLNKGGVHETRLIRHYSGCGSLLDYEGSYAEAKGMTPANKAQVVHFLSDRRRIRRNSAVIADKTMRREVYHF